MKPKITTPNESSAPEKMVTPDVDDRLIHDQEGILEIYIKANVRAKAAKAAAPAAKREADKKSVAAATAILQIHSHLGKGLLKDCPTLEAFCERKGGISSSQAYRLLDTGRFIARLKCHSPKKPFEEWRLSGEGQIRKFLKIVPKDQQVACWQEIVAKTPPDKLTGAMVTKAAMEFMRRQPGAVVEQVPRHDLRKKMEKHAKKIREVFEGLADSDDFEPFLEGLLKFADRVDMGIAKGNGADPGDEASRPEDESDGEDESEADAGASTGLVSDESAAPKPAKSRRKAAHSRPRGTRRAVVIEECNSLPPESPGKPPVGEIPRSDHMTARLLHAVLQSPIDYDGWLAEAQRDRPDYFIILDDGGDALIALEWAKAVAFHADNSPSSRLALNLIVRALNESPGDKGAAADDLFSQAFTNSELEPDDGVDPYILRRAQEGKSDSIRRYEFQAEHPANRI